MTVPPEVITVARQWVEKAEHDIKNAEYTLTLKKGCPFDTVCFHAQQCAEKYLKALLTIHEVDFPKSHDLTELHALLPSRLRATIPSSELVELNPYAIETRYPGEWDPQSRADADRAVEISRRIRAAARKHLPAQILAAKKTR